MKVGRFWMEHQKGRPSPRSGPHPRSHSTKWRMWDRRIKYLSGYRKSKSIQAGQIHPFEVSVSRVFFVGFAKVA